MNYIIFEDNKSELLSPFTDVHATFELITGAVSNIDRILSQIPNDSSIQLFVRDEIEDIICEKYPNMEVNPDIFKPGIYLNGNTIWYAEDINKLDKNLSYSNSYGLVAFLYKDNVHKNDIIELFEKQRAISSKLSVSSVKYLWDIFDLLAETIKKDSLTLYNYKKGILHPSCVMINDDDIIINEGASISAATVLDASNGPIIIDKNSLIDIGSVIKGPAYIGKGSTINPASKILGSVSIGEYSKVGGEIKDSIIHSFSNKQHDGFLGNSYVGEWVNLGANTNTSNLKNNYSTIRVQLNDKDIVNTNKMFIGSIIGDFSCTGISTKLNSGTYIGTGANIFGDGFQNKYIKSFSWGENDKVGLNRFIKRCEIVMKRRQKSLSEPLKNRLINLWKR